jgi:hypothetical protein
MERLLSRLTHNIIERAWIFGAVVDLASCVGALVWPAVWSERFGRASPQANTGAEAEV